MPKVILIIGRLCSGKTTYARKVAREEHAVHLNCDELMRTLFPEPLGEDYDRYLARAFDYLFTLTRRLAESGCVPVLDFGFLSRASRQQAARALEGLTLDWRYLEVPEDEWRRRIARRNVAILAGRGQPDEYYVDDGLLQKLIPRFEPPSPEEGLQVRVIASGEVKQPPPFPA